MSESQKKTVQPAPCSKCHTLDANPIYNDMCSACYKQSQTNIQKQPSNLQSPPSPIVSQPISEAKAPTQAVKVNVDQILRGNFSDQVKTDHHIQKQRQEEEENFNSKKEQLLIKKCSICQKKVGLLGYECKYCSNNLCKFHRLPEDHQCSIDFVAQGRKKLKLEIPKVVKSKISPI